MRSKIYQNAFTIARLDSSDWSPGSFPLRIIRLSGSASGVVDHIEIHHFLQIFEQNQHRFLHSFLTKLVAHNIQVQIAFHILRNKEIVRRKEKKVFLLTSISIISSCGKLSMALRKSHIDPKAQPTPNSCSLCVLSLAATLILN